MADVMGKGINAVEDWPTPIAAFLEREQQGAASRPGRFGARKALGPFQNWVRDLGPGPVQAVLLAVVEASIQSDPVLRLQVHRSRLFAQQAKSSCVQHQQNVMVNLGEAASVLGRSHASMRRLLADGLLTAEADGGRGMPIALPRDAVALLAEAQKNAVLLVGAAAILGVSKARVLLILSSDLLRGEPRLALGQAARLGIDRGSLRRLLADLEARLPETAPSGGLVGFEFAAAAFRHRGFDIVALLREIMEWRLAPAAIAHEATGLKRLRFRHADVAAVLGRLKKGSVATVQEAARTLGLKWEVVAHLTRKGILRIGDGGVDVAEIQRFHREVVSGSELARERGTSPRALAAALRERGVHPISGPDVDGGRQNFFERDACGRGNGSALHRWPSFREDRVSIAQPLPLDHTKRPGE
ncbi:hypothetical protein [Muricoccus aerilatus]|uniref:hypothetical protein n=1 Tax=Muricoccus aerilatus TaxID=452982 RepID=UPI001FDFF1EA|nr:hypothetical protein [Roseomonas aerilata]